MSLAYPIARSLEEAIAPGIRTARTQSEAVSLSPGFRVEGLETGWLHLPEDQARALPTWHRWEALSGFAIICVAARADSTGADSPFESLNAQIPGLIRLKMPPMPVSATEIRHKIALGQDIAPLVFDSVARYIEQHHLYQSA